MRHSTVGPIVLIVVAVVLSPTAWGDVFLLRNGGRISGELLNPDESPRETYRIATNSGGRITLDRLQVKQRITKRSDQQKYTEIRPQYPDTVDGQWELAQWCFGQGLLPQYRTHLGRVIELEPDHAEARRGLGYDRHDGKWMTQDEVMIARGYRRYKRGWRTAQEIELIERREKVEAAESEWTRKIARWRTWFGTDRGQQGAENILAIDDPVAVAGLVRGLKNEQAEKVRLLYVDALAKLGTPNAIEALAVRAMDDASKEVRLTCLDYLSKVEDPRVVAYFVGKLRHKDNRVVNWAGVCLSHLKPPSSVGPLINALITVHTYKVVTSNPGSMSATFSPNGSSGPGGLSMGGGPKYIKRTHQNQQVLDALAVITRKNFSFDRQAWQYWYASQKKQPEVDARRD